MADTADNGADDQSASDMTPQNIEVTVEVLFESSTGRIVVYHDPPLSEPGSPSVAPTNGQRRTVADAKARILEEKAATADA